MSYVMGYKRQQTTELHGFESKYASAQFSGGG